MFNSLLEILDGRTFGRAALKFHSQSFEIDFADVVDLGFITGSFRLRLDGLVYHPVQLANDVGDVGLLPVLLEALVDDVDSIVLRTMRIDPLDIDARLELLENLPAHHLKSFARLVILVSRFLCAHNGSVTLEAGFRNDVVKRCAAFSQESPNERDGLRQIGQ